MKYSKPEVTVLGSAIDEVESILKSYFCAFEMCFPYLLSLTANAYEADE